MVRVLPRLSERTNVVSSSERTLHLGTKTTKPGESKVLELGSKIWFSRPIFWPWAKWYVSC